MSEQKAESAATTVRIVDRLRQSAAIAPELRAWKVLVVDDEEDVHDATRLALARARILDRPVQLLHARSRSEAMEVAAGHPDIAVAIIDVVMEKPDAGLELIHDLRAAGFLAMRVMLRTGQPGYAPELQTVTQYEIDDYRTKSELTRTRLLTSLTSAIRAFDQIRSLSRSRAGLEMIVESATELFQRTNLELFSQGVLTQIAGILGVEANGLVSVGEVHADPVGGSIVVSAAGRFSRLIGNQVSFEGEPELAGLLRSATVSKEPVIADGHMAIHITGESGRAMWVLIEADLHFADAGIALLKLFATNISIGFENLSLVERLDRLAYLDPVLQVPNLNAFLDSLGRHLAAPEEKGRAAYIGIDNFSEVIVTYGLDMLPKLLTRVFDMLLENSKDLVIARIGDGTFGLLGSRESLDRDKIVELFDKPVQVENVEVPVTATSVLVDIDGMPDDPRATLRDVMAAFLHVNQHRKGECVLYDEWIRSEVLRIQKLRSALERAAASGEGFSVSLQPKCNLLTDEVIGAEALMRWSLDGEPVSPADFIPIAEAAGQIEMLTYLVLSRIGEWAKARHGKPLPVSVNISMANLNATGFAERLFAKISEAGLSPEILEFEVTEGVAMSKMSWAREQLGALKQAGFRIAFDDFGTGYASLGQFEKMPVDAVKLDRSFISSLDIKTARHSLAATVIGMATSLEVDCIAEGIETELQKQALVFLGCTVGQGYLLGHPNPIGEFDAKFGLS